MKKSSSKKDKKNAFNDTIILKYICSQTLDFALKYSELLKENYELKKKVENQERILTGND